MTPAQEQLTNASSVPPKWHSQTPSSGGSSDSSDEDTDEDAPTSHWSDAQFWIILVLVSVVILLLIMQCCCGIFLLREGNDGNKVQTVSVGTQTTEVNTVNSPNTVLDQGLGPSITKNYLSQLPDGSAVREPKFEIYSYGSSYSG